MEWAPLVLIATLVHSMGGSDAAAEDPRRDLTVPAEFPVVRVVVDLNPCRVLPASFGNVS
jgi:hypothetical protein